MIRRLTLAAAFPAVLALVATGCSTGTTDPATNVTTGAATLNATINPDGDSYRYRFEWRQASASTMNVTPWRSVSSPGTATRRVSEQISGLVANTRYVFRFCGEETTGTRPTEQPDRGGYACGELREFTTSGPAGGGDQFPNRATTGVPTGWVPRETRSTNLTVSTAGAVVQDIRFTNGADLIIRAPNVTVRRVDFQAGVIDTNQCGTVIEDTTFQPMPGQPYVSEGEGVVRWGCYTLRRVEIVNRGEGPRLGSTGPVTIEDTFIYIKAAEPGTQACNDTHADGIQGYHGRGLNLRNATIIFSNYCGTSPYFVGWGGRNPSQPTINTGTYNVNRLLVAGGGFVFRQQVPGSITGLRIVNNSWVYGPIANACSKLSPWEAKIVTLDGDYTNVNGSYRVTGIVRDQPCHTEVYE